MYFVKILFVYCWHYILTLSDWLIAMLSTIYFLYKYLKIHSIYFDTGFECLYEKLGWGKQRRGRGSQGGGESWGSSRGVWGS